MDDAGIVLGAVYLAAGVLWPNTGSPLRLPATAGLVLALWFLSLTMSRWMGEQARRSGGPRSGPA